MRFLLWAMPLTIVVVVVHLITWSFSPGLEEQEGRTYLALLSILPSYTLTAILYVFAYFASGFHIVDQWNRRPIMRFGKYLRTLNGGIAWIEPLTTNALTDIPTRTVVNTLKVEHVQTHDNVPIELKFIMTSSVRDVEKFTLAVAGGWQAMQNRGRAVVAELIGATELDPILHDRAALSSKILETIRQRVSEWGIHVDAIEISDIAITDESISKAISMKARAKKEAEAELVRAQMQAKIAKELRLAAVEFTPESWRLKRMEVLLELCRSGKNNIILIPSELTDAIANLLPALHKS